jgi:hypothetical protein
MGAPKPRGGEEEARGRASGIREQAAQSGAAVRACFCQRAKNMSRDLETSRHDAQWLEHRAAANKQLGD